MSETTETPEDLDTLEPKSSENDSSFPSDNLPDSPEIESNTSEEAEEQSLPPESTGPKAMT